MNNRTIKIIAKDYASGIIMNALESGVHSEHLTTDDEIQLQYELEIIAIKIGTNTSGSLDEIVKHHKNKA